MVRRAKSCLESNPTPTRNAWRAQTKLYCTRTQRSHRDWVRPTFECLSVSCGGTGLQWPASGTGALAAEDLGHAVLPTMGPLSRWPTICRTIIPRKFSHCWESCRTHNRFPNLGIWQRDWEPPGNLTSKASGIWLQNFHRTGETYSGRALTKPSVH